MVTATPAASNILRVASAIRVPQGPSVDTTVHSLPPDMGLEEVRTQLRAEQLKPPVGVMLKWGLGGALLLGLGAALIKRNSTKGAVLGGLGGAAAAWGAKYALIGASLSAMDRM